MKKTGFIVFSENGHSLSIAEKIKKIIEKEKIQAEINQIKIESEEPVNAATSNFSFNEASGKVDKYDFIVFISFVTGFALNPVMKKYLSDMPEVRGSCGICIAAKQFKSKWTGGTQALKKMKKICRKKGMKIIGEGIFSRKMENYEELIKDQAEFILKALE